jgi:glycosyltransferase involved in cell wall biosynthesis
VKEYQNQIIKKGVTVVWNNQKISLVMPTYREKNSIRDCILKFLETEIFDQIIIVDNNAEKGTLEAISDLEVAVTYETKQGYGAAIKKGLRIASGDLIIICEPDGTFTPSDVFKLLSYSKECDVVFGSRTVQTFIWGDANMGWFLRWGNWAVAKYLELLFNTSYMSDVGCTFRLLNRKSVNFINSLMLSDASSFGLEMQVAILKLKQLRYVQIPVNYGSRVGASTITGEVGKSIKLGLRMIFIITRQRLNFSGRN